jgi:electron transport complex protein RnfE
MTLALVLISGVRELLGSGTLLGYRVLGGWFEPWVIMVLPPGGFLTMGTLLMLVAWVRLRKSARPETGGIPGDAA